MSDVHQAYIDRCISAVLHDGFNPSLASITPLSVARKTRSR